MVADLGEKDIDEIAFPINDSIDLARLSCLGFCRLVGRGSAVLGLVVPVCAELIAVLDDAFRCAHYWFSDQ